MAINEQSYGVDHRHAAIRFNNLARLFKDTTCLDEAEPMYRRALAIDEASFGKAHPNVAELLRVASRRAEAEPLMRRVVEIVLSITVTPSTRTRISWPCSKTTMACS